MTPVATLDAGVLEVSSNRGLFFLRHCLPLKDARLTQNSTLGMQKDLPNPPSVWVPQEQPGLLDPL